MSGLWCSIMNGSTNKFSSSGLADNAELKAILFALGSCFLFIGFLAAVQRSGAMDIKPVVKVRVSPQPPPPPPAPLITERVPDMNDRFRVVPTNFKGLDFATHSYGDYQLSDGTNRHLVLIDGKFRDFGDASNWFDLNDVFYTDLTGDGKPEAIVMITHLECGRTCDGGKNLLYVFSQKSGVVNQILKYESGSGLEGCSLKSLVVKNGRLSLDLFGRCPQPAGTSQEFVTQETYNLTRLDFSFNGTELVQKNKTVLLVPNRHEVSYGVEVRITDNRTPEHEL